MSDDIVALAIEDLSTIIEIENDYTEINPLNADKDNFTNQALVEVVDPNDEEQARNAVGVADKISFEAQDPNKEQALMSESKEEGSNDKSKDQNHTNSQLVKIVEKKVNDSQEKEQNPIIEKLIDFTKDPSKKTLKFSHDISPHDRILVHKFVQDNNLTCESTGNNCNHEFVVGKVTIGRFGVDLFEQKSTVTCESFVLAEAEELDFGSETDDVEMADQEEDLASETTNQDDVIELHSDTQEVVAMESDSLEQSQQAQSQFKVMRPNSRKFKQSDLRNVNQHLNLRDLKLENVSGCYRMDRPGSNVGALRSICRAVGVPFKVGVDPVTPDKSRSSHRAFLLINNVLVSNGFGQKEKDAKNMAIRIALRYLEYKGLTLWNPARIEDERSIVSKHIEEFGGVDEVKQNFKRVVEEFLDDPNLVVLNVGGTFDKSNTGAPNSNTAALSAVCKQFNLRQTIYSDHFQANKINSIIHKLQVYPSQNNVTSNLSTAVVEQAPAQSVTIPPNVKVLSKFEASSLRRLTEGKYEPLNVSEQLKDLRPLKLDGYFGIVNKNGAFPEKLLKLMDEMANAAGVSFLFDIKGPYDGSAQLRWRSLISINHQFIAKGFDKTEAQCKRKCAMNAFYFLKSIGLQLIFDHEIPGEQIKKFDRVDIEASSIKQQFDTFLEDKTLLKLVFCCRLTQAEKELLDALCERHSIFKTFNGTGELITSKINSYLHKMESLKKVAPAPELTTKVITKEELSVNSSIRFHIESFIKDNTVQKIQFSDDLDLTQKELIELLADKHKLHQEIDDSNKTILIKSGIKTKAPQITPKTKVYKMNQTTQLTQRKYRSKPARVRRQIRRAMELNSTNRMLDNSFQGNSNPPKKLKTQKFCDRKPTSNYPTTNRPRGRRNISNLMSNDWSKNQAANENTVGPLRSETEFSWVKDAVNKAVSSVSRTMNIAPPGHAIPRKSLLNPSYLSNVTRSNTTNSWMKTSTYSQSQSSSSRFTSLGTDRKKLLCPASSTTFIPGKNSAAAGPSSSHIAAARPSLSHIATARPSLSHIAAARPSSSHIAAARPSSSHIAAARPSSSHIAAARPSSSHIAAARPSLSLIAAARPSSSHIAAAGPSPSGLLASTLTKSHSNHQGVNTNKTLSAIRHVPFSQPVEQFNSASNFATQYQNTQAYQNTQSYYSAQYHQNTQGYQNAQAFQNSQSYPNNSGQSWHAQSGWYANFGNYQ